MKEKCYIRGYIRVASNDINVRRGNGNSKIKFLDRVGKSK